MGSSTQVFPDNLGRFRIDIVIDGELALAHLNALPRIAGAGGVLKPNEFQLEGLCREFLTGFCRAHNPSRKALPLLDNAGHLFFESAEVLGSKSLGDIEVVVEPIDDGGANS